MTHAEAGRPTTAPRTRTLADFSSSTTFHTLPEAVVHQARRALVDWSAATLLGSAEPASVTVRSVLAADGGGGGCTVVGTDLRVGTLFAALANGYASHLLDFDDVYNPPTTTIHLGSCVWPAVLAIGELRHLSGQEAITAYVAGFEVGARAAKAAGKRHYESGWHVTGTTGHVAAAAAAARALGLSAAATVNALGAAATQAAGIREVYGSDSKPLHPGKAAMDGVLSALLAEQGFTSTETALDGPRGLLRVVSPEPDPDQLVDGLGSVWNVLDNGHKLYPSASLTHPAIDAAHEIRQVDPSTITAIEVRLAPFAADVTALRHPTTGTQAKFSTAHCVAVALLHSDVRPEHFTDRSAADPGLRTLRDTVTVVSDAAVAKRGCRLIVATSDGQVRTAEVVENRGTPGAPLLDGELEDKLILAGDPLIGGRATDALIKQCWSLDHVADVADLADHLSTRTL